MKRMLLAVISLAFLIGISGGLSGGTDSKGGHYNRKTGEYHYRSSSVWIIL